MALYNERKKSILDFVFENDFVTSSQISNALSLEIHNSRTLLKNYFLQGLLAREHDGIGFLYSLTEKGLERLEYFELIM